MCDVNRIVPPGGNECQYYNISSSLNIVNENSNVIHLNIKTVNSILDEILEHLKALNKEFHVIVLTEPFIQSEDDWIDIPGYNVFHLIPTRKIEAGCTIMVQFVSGKQIPLLQKKGFLISGQYSCRQYSAFILKPDRKN